jgi:hypothetical protein
MKCKASSRSKASVCFECKSNLTRSIISANIQLSNAQRDAFILAQRCKACNFCFEDSTTFATLRGTKCKAQSGITKKSTPLSVLVTPLANCSCIDCPQTFKRHRAHEKELEAIAVLDALEGLQSPG